MTGFTIANTYLIRYYNGVNSTVMFSSGAYGILRFPDVNVHTYTHTHTVYHMKETGWEKVSSTDVAELHYQYKDEKLGQAS